MISKDFQRVKMAAKDKDIEFIIIYLSNLNDSETFQAFKHQKILYYFARHEKFTILGEAYLSCASKIPTINLSQESLYIDFVIITSIILEKSEYEINNIINSIKDYHLLDALFPLVKWIHKTTNDIQKKHLNLFNQKNFNNLNNNDKASCTNTILHNLNAELVDLNISTTRLIQYLINNLSDLGSTNGKNIDDKTIEKLVRISSFLEAIYYRVDQVSYGELSISNVDFQGNIITLEFNNIDLQIARQVGIRRSISNQQKEWRTLRLFIKRYKEIAVDIVMGYKNLYQNEGYKIVKSDKKIINYLFGILSHYFNYEDEILLYSYQSASEIDAIYLVAIELLCQIVVLSNIEISEDPLDFGELIFGVNFNVYEDYLSQVIDLTYIKKAFSLFYSENPTKLIDLKTKPLFVTKNGEVLGILELAQYWASTGSVNIRRQILKGDYLGKKYGEILEEYLEQYLRITNGEY